MRTYDPRVARFLSRDPLYRNYPMLTPYQFASNTPLQAIDLDGLEAIQITGWMENGVILQTQTFYDNYTSDMRVQYVLPDVGTGTATEMWVNLIEIRYEPSFSEKLLTGALQTSESIGNYVRSVDKNLKKMAEGKPTYQGVDGMEQMGQAMQDFGDYLILAGIASSETGIGAAAIPVGGLISTLGTSLEGLSQLSQEEYGALGVTVASEVVPFLGGKAAREAINKEVENWISRGVDKEFAKKGKRILENRVTLIETGSSRAVSTQKDSNNE